MFRKMNVKDGYALKIAIESGIDYKALASDGYDAVINDIEWEYKLTMKLKELIFNIRLKMCL